MSKITIIKRETEIQICRGQMLIYVIPIFKIDEVMQPGNIAIHIIRLLHNYKLDDHDLLYQIAKMTYAMVPDNEINWIGTFAIVEHYFHSQKAFEAILQRQGNQRKYLRTKLVTRKIRTTIDTAEDKRNMEILAVANLLKYEVPVKVKF